MAISRAMEMATGLSTPAFQDESNTPACAGTTKEERGPARHILAAVQTL